MVVAARGASDRARANVSVAARPKRPATGRSPLHIGASPAQPTGHAAHDPDDTPDPAGGVGFRAPAPGAVGKAGPAPSPAPARFSGFHSPGRRLPPNHRNLRPTPHESRRFFPQGRNFACHAAYY